MEATFPRYFVGAYPAAPADRELRAEFYTLLAADPAVTGIELPIEQARDLLDDPALLRAMPQHWSITLTLLPETMRRMAADHNYGLASASAEGRAAAVADVVAVASLIPRIENAAGREMIEAVLLNAAPRRAPGARGAGALADALQRVGSQAWGRTRLLLEHCDAAVEDHPPEKGFLPLPVEIESVRAANVQGNLEVAINWGRSAVETRTADGPLAHVKLARSAGLLGSVIFAGCAPTHTVWGPPWADAHLPPREASLPELGSTDARHCLMGRPEIADCLVAAGPAVTVGLKVFIPKGDYTVAERAAMTRASCSVLADAWLFAGGGANGRAPSGGD